MHKVVNESSWPTNKKTRRLNFYKYISSSSFLSASHVGHLQLFLVIYSNGGPFPKKNIKLSFEKIYNAINLLN